MYNSRLSIQIPKRPRFCLEIRKDGRETDMKYDSSHTFVTSDHHFGSWKINQSPWREPVFSQEEEEELIAKWNSVVKPTDLVIHVGDFCDSGAVDLMEYRKRLNGNIVLVKGNHDSLPDDVYNAVFSSVCEELVIKELDLIFRHCPNPNDGTGFRQVYGHEHIEGGLFCPMGSKTSFCACVMRHNGFPTSLSDILIGLEKRQ